MRETPSSGHPLIDLVLWIWFALTALAVAFVVYWFLHRVPAPPLWQQAIESTIHCVAGIGTGILIAVLFMSWLRLPMGVELLAEYVAGFAVGLFLFQAPCMKSTFAGKLRAGGAGHVPARDSFDECGHGRDGPDHDHPYVTR